MTTGITQSKTEIVKNFNLALANQHFLRLCEGLPNEMAINPMNVEYIDFINDEQAKDDGN